MKSLSFKSCCLAVSKHFSSFSLEIWDRRFFYHCTKSWRIKVQGLVYLLKETWRQVVRSAPSRHRNYCDEFTPWDEHYETLHKLYNKIRNILISECIKKGKIRSFRLFSAIIFNFEIEEIMPKECSMLKYFSQKSLYNNIIFHILEK